MNDLLETFQQYGQIKGIKLNHDGIAYIIFYDRVNAYIAWKLLNHLELEDSDIKLSVEPTNDNIDNLPFEYIDCP